MPTMYIHGVPLYYEVQGKGEPLLFIAGLGADHSSWSGVVKAFSPQFQTIIFDNLGVGQSGRMKRPYTVRHMADGVIRLLDYLQIPRAHMIGHSMGGYIAQQIAISYPARVQKLILEGTAAVSSERNNVLFFDFLKKLQDHTDFKEWVRTWTFWSFSSQTFRRKEFVDTFIKKAAAYPYPPSVDGFKTQTEAIAQFDVRSKLSSLKAKTMILQGEQDSLIRPDEAKELVQHIRGSEMKLIKDAAHCIHIENPKLFVNLVIDFLTRIKN